MTRWVGLLLGLVGLAGAGEVRSLVIADGDSAAAFAGGTLDPTLKQTGTGAIRWAHAESPTLSLVQPPTDWSARSAMGFWLHSEVATKSSFMLILESENPATEGLDYYMVKLTLDFTGWRRFVFPRRSFSVARTPRGWDKIGRVFFTATGWDNTPDPRAVVRLDQWEMFDVEGPMLTDAELLAALDLTPESLSAVRTAAEAGDLPAAKTALAAYFRARTSVPWWFDPRAIDTSIRHNKAAADRTVKGEIQVVTLWHTFPGGDIDWFYNPTVVRADLPVNHEWQWQLGRMHTWPELGRTWWATGDPVYARTFVKQLRSWVKQCPRPDGSGNTTSSAWRTIECGIRLAGSWPDAWHRFLTSPDFTDDDLILYLKSSLEQARHLRRHPTGGNWLTMELNGLFTTACLFPELREAAEWRKFAIDRLYRELDAQFLPDGAQVELTPGYHNVALGNIRNLPRLAKRVGRFDELPADFTARMTKAYEFNLYLMTPDRDLPRFNDSWPVNVPGQLRDGLEFFPDRADFRWVVSDGREGAPPATGSHPFPHAGYFVMRSGWDKEACYGVLDAGPLGYGHYHQDKLNLVVWAYGRELLFDGGGGSYEASKWRSYGTDTFSHNTVLVDGRPQRRSSERSGFRGYPAVDAGWRSEADHDFVRGVYDEGYGQPDRKPATHVRRVLFVKPDLFLVVDTLTPTDDQPHTYQARWHLKTTHTRQDGTSVRTTDEGLPNLAVVPLLTDGLEVRSASQQTEPELLGWHVDKDTDPQYKPATTVLHTVRGTGVKQFVTLLVPLRPGAAGAVTEVRAAAGRYAVTLADGRQLSFTVDPDPAGPVTSERPGG